MNRRLFLGGIATGALSLVLWRTGLGEAEAAYPFALSDAEWRRKLSPQAYAVLREASTEYPNSSPLNKEHRRGTFACAGCALPLFSSKTKFDSGTGWPSFWQPLPKAVGTSSDRMLGYVRTEVHCARCGGHLGHVFDDGPRPTGKRYCMNGAALTFAPA
jgi:peptide-methionine (R)-S-oxide reductase